MTNATTNPATATASKAKKVVTRIGIVESDKRSQTRTVAVPNVRTHAKYGKTIRSRSKIQVHDEANTSKLGDLVEITPCRPVSKTKRWTLVKVIRREAGLKFEGVAVPETAPEATN